MIGDIIGDIFGEVMIGKDPSEKAQAIIRALFGLVGVALSIAGMIKMFSYDAGLAFRMAAFFLFAITCGIRAQRKKPVTGSEGIIGEIGIAISNIKPLGKVRVHGEFWNAECKDEVINKGDEVEVVSVNHLTLIVKKKK